MSAQKNIRVLIIEDHQDIARNIGDYLELEDYVVDFAMDGISGMHLVLTQTYDVIILDLMLPGMDGLTLCRKMREEAENQTPVLMLTARETLSDKLRGFDCGADDYLVKPFALEELLARVIALSKRHAIRKNETLIVADIVLNLGTMTVTRSGQVIDLNRVCTVILKTLMKAYPNLVTREELENALWGESPPGSDALRSHLYNLRSKIDKPFQVPLIQTVHGMGYRLRESDEA